MAADFTGIFFVKRIRPRLYHATYLPTKRKFELSRASHTNQYWEARELNKKGKTSKYSMANSRKSRDDLLHILLERIKSASREERRKEVIKNWKPKPKVHKYRFRPWKYADLKSKELSTTKTMYKADTGEVFIISKNSEGWSCLFHQSPGAQHVAIGMSSKELALLELYYYLDTAWVDLSEDDRKERRRICYK